MKKSSMAFKNHLPTKMPNISKKVTTNSLFARNRSPNLSLTICLLAVCLILGKLFFTGTGIFVISSSSMEPSYPIYSVVIIHKGGFDELKEGDVIIYKSDALNGGMAFHRVTRITASGVYTKGDKNKNEDNQLITTETYVGRACFKITFFARYLSYIKKPAGLLLFFICPIATIMLLIYSIRTIKNTVKDYEKNN